MRLRRLAVTSAAATLLLTSCSGSGGGGDNQDGGSTAPSTQQEATLQVKTQADGEKLVKTLADQVAATVGAPLQKWKTNPVPCDNPAGGTDQRGPWAMNGFATVAVAPADQITTLSRLRDHWTSLGYEITEYRTFAPDNKRGTVSARVPADQTTVSAQSTVPGTGLALVIATTCYEPAPSENPGN